MHSVRIGSEQCWGRGKWGVLEVGSETDRKDLDKFLLEAEFPNRGALVKLYPQWERETKNKTISL